MVGADLALAALINHAADVYKTTMPPYIAYEEHTHIKAAVFGGINKDINRAITVRVADDYAVMQDLPGGGTNIGSAFPVVPFFDPFSTFGYCYHAGLKKIDLTFYPGKPYIYPAPATDPSVDMVVQYMSYWAPRYAPDSTDDAIHLLIDPTPQTGKALYPAEVKLDPATGLPSHVVMKDNGSDATIGLDYEMIDNHWVVVHGTYSATEGALGMSFHAESDTTFTNFTFPQTPPDPRLAASPSPQPFASCPP
jgi:hypothetical protein